MISVFNNVGFKFSATQGGSGELKVIRQGIFLFFFFFDDDVRYLDN